LRDFRPSLFFFVTLKPRIEGYTKSMSLENEIASEPPHTSVEKLFSNSVLYGRPVDYKAFGTPNVRVT
jgi:hypothetical protein